MASATGADEHVVGTGLHAGGDLEIELAVLDLQRAERDIALGGLAHGTEVDEDGSLRTLDGEREAAAGIRGRVAHAQRVGRGGQRHRDERQRGHDHREPTGHPSPDSPTHRANIQKVPI
jgi:hypothetical protein